MSDKTEIPWEGTSSRYIRVTESLFFPRSPYRDSQEDHPQHGRESQINIDQPDYLEDENHPGFVVHRGATINLIDCSSCEFIHAFPRPSEEELEQFYRDNFYNQDRKKDYFDKQRSQLDWWNRVFDKRLLRMEKFLGRKGRLLDVGCGAGFFLSRAKAAGWEVIGLEPSKDAQSYAVEELGLQVFLGGVGDLQENLAGSKVDVAYSHGVIEHLRDPVQEVTEIIAALENNGIVFTSAANDFNPYQASAVASLGVAPWWILPPEHLNYFTVNSLKKFHEKLGFTTLDLRTSFPIDQFLLMGENYIVNPSRGARAHHRRVSFEESLIYNGYETLLSRLEEANATLGVGRQTDYIGRLNNER